MQSGAGIHPAFTGKAFSGQRRPIFRLGGGFSLVRSLRKSM